MKQCLKKYRFVICMIVLAIIKQILVVNIPIAPYPNQAYDDQMMVDMAINIRAGNWLGEYTSNTLVKGPVFPFILALINYGGLSYIRNNESFVYDSMYLFYILYQRYF